MGKSGAIPDAWDDDWVTNADSSARVTDPPPSDKKLSKAERRARQAEFNRQLWEDAEAPKDSYFLNTRDDVPLKTEFKPAVKVLSRKPMVKAAGVMDSSGLQQLNLDDDEEDDENESGKIIMTLEERQQKALLDREEKQKKYEEVRQRLFGSGGPSESQTGESSTPPLQAQQNGAARGRSKSRGGRDTRPSPSTGNRSRQLFDPNSNAKADPAYVQKKENPPTSGSSTPVKQQIVRSPRGPETTGKAGFGFFPREGI